jgi:hypothetical protein
MAETNKTSSSSPMAVALMGWIIPGGGYLLLKQRARGYTIGITILTMFIFGLLIGGIRVATAPEIMSGSGTVLNQIGQKPWYIAQVLNGPVCMISSALAEKTRVESHAHSAEIGTLYTAIAGMLNLLAIIDSSYRATKGEGE